MNEIEGHAPDAGWLRGVVEQVVAGIVVVQHGRVAYANPRAAEMLERPALAGTGVDELLEPQQAIRLAASVRELTAGARASIDEEYRIALPSGDVLPCAVRATLTRWAGAPAVLGVLQDLTEARRVEQALEYSESTNRTLMDALSDGVFVAQAERFVYANHALPRWLGYAPEEFVGLPFVRVLAPESLDTWTARYRARVGSGPEPNHTYEVRFLRKDGSAIELELVANRTQWRERPAVLGVLRDITQRKRTEAELARHRERLEELVHERTRELEQAEAARAATEDFARTIADNQPTLLAYLDRELRVQFANRAYLAWFGKTREEVIGRDARDSFGQNVLAGSEDGHVGRVFGGEAFGTQSDMLGHDGRVGHFWIYRLPDVREGEIRGYYFIATDITELRRSERRLQELNAALIRAESFTRGIADHLPARIAYWDQDERCRFANRAYFEWYGRTTEQVLGKTEREIFGDRLPRERETRARAALRGEPQEFESDETGADGRPAIWQVHYLPDRSGGEVRGFFKLASDITAAKRAQAELRTLNAELVVARDRAEDAAQAKSAFIANMSHEIRTPMNVIIGLTHLMQRDAHDPVTSDRLGKVGDAAQHLLDIINDILDLSKIDAGKLVLAPVDFSVDGLLERSVSMVADGARRKGLAVSIDRGDLPTALRGDALRLSQVLVNLLSNAVKFTSRGSVALRCGVLACEGAEWHVRFSVHDTGMGISHEARQRLFSPFEQADRSTTRRFGGTGLGLSIARELAQLMGGTVGVESEVNRGSVFWFSARLQAAQSLDVPAPALSAATPDAPSAEVLLRRRHAGARVLIADDNRINQELAIELLRLVDLQVDVADNGRIAAEMAEAGGYDLILMDMQMPEMDGLESTRRIRALPRLDATPVIAMTASAFGADRDACLAAGMNDHLGKPVNPVTLYETLLRWLDETHVARPEATPLRAPAPAPLVAAPADPLEAVEALDLVRGLSLFAGQRALYLQALGYFVDLYGAGLPAVERYLDGAPDATREAVRRDVHSMGGAAAALGAIDLENAAHDIEAMARSDRGTPAPEADLRAAMGRLREDLGTLVRQLRAVLGALPAAAGKHVT